MWLPPSRTIGVYDSGAFVAFSVSSGAAWAAQVLAGVRLRQLGRSYNCRPGRWPGGQSDSKSALGVFLGHIFLIFHKHCIFTRLLRPLGGGGVLAACDAENFRGTGSCTGVSWLLDTNIGLKWCNEWLEVMVQHFWAIRIVGPVLWVPFERQTQGRGGGLTFCYHICILNYKHRTVWILWRRKIHSYIYSLLLTVESWSEVRTILKLKYFNFSLKEHKKKDIWQIKSSN